MQNTVKIALGIFCGLGLAIIGWFFYMHQQPRAPQAVVQPQEQFIPITVTWRRALTGRGQVLIVHSTADKDLPLTVEVSNSKSDRKTLTVTSAARGIVEIGVQEGWDFMTGDSIKVMAPGFVADNFHCP